MINGRFVRYLNANDLRQLADYQRKVDHWQKKLDLHIEHRVNAGENQRRQQMNAAFGPDGSYVKSFKGPFWEEQHLNTPPPTTLPTFAPEQIAEVPTEQYPDPPAFCLQ
ncbi:unnamed protein product [Anisakis simplex]|uniref:Pepsin-I3 domain-containing protein n=1 Tax=Anisakis simplex TaxID=6269 RepID=A0A0M3KBL7_ANISI|nr:unnamed protein product [Anisakis simplex]